MRSPIKRWNLRTCAEQLARYECEAGPIEMNDAYIWLQHASRIGPEFLPGQVVAFEVSATVAGIELKEWAPFTVVGCRLASDANSRFWVYDLSNDPPDTYHYGTVQFHSVPEKKLSTQHA